MKRLNLKIIWKIFQLILSLIIIFIFVEKIYTSSEHLGGVFKVVNFSNISFSFLLSGVGYIFFSLPPSLFIQNKLGHIQIKFLVRIWIQCFWLRYIPGKVLLILERVRRYSIIGVDKKIGISLVIYESLLHLNMALFLCGIFILFNKEGSISGFEYIYKYNLQYVLLPCSIFIFTIFYLLRKIHFPFRPLLSLQQSLNCYWPELNKFLFMNCMNFIGWILLAYSGYLITSDILPSISWSNFFLCYFISYIFGMVLATVPVGLGVREGVLYFLLSQNENEFLIHMILFIRILQTFSEIPLYIWAFCSKEKLEIKTKY